MNQRGKIERTATGHVIRPGCWREQITPPSPQARLDEGRIVHVSFTFVVADAATRAELDEMVQDELNGCFDLWGEVQLTDVGARTDRPELMRQAIEESTAAFARSRAAQTRTQPDVGAGDETTEGGGA